MTQTLKTLIPLSIVCTLLIGFSYTQSAWTEPTAGTVAATNTEPPINTGSAPQVKGGALGVDALAVYGDAAVDGNVIASTSVRSRQYCDENGLNCISGDSLSSKAKSCRMVVATGGAPAYVSTASCNPGEYMEYGGGSCLDSNGAVHLSRPLGEGWSVDCYRRDNAGEASTRAYAKCCIE